MQRRQNTSSRKNWRSLSRAAAIALLAVGLAACSSVPDWANPVKAYDSVFGSTAPSNPRAQAAQRSGAAPNLSSVPARPATSSAAERNQATQGLVADRGNARYTDDIVRSDDEGGVPLPPRGAQAPSTQVARSVPPPPARSALPPMADPPPSTSLRDTPASMPATPRETVSAAPAPPPPAPMVTARAAPAADPLADRRVTPAPSASMATSADPLADRRVTPQPRTAGAVNDTLESRRTITQPRSAPLPQAVPPVLPQAAERAPMAPPPASMPPAAPAMAQAQLASPVAPPPVMAAPVQAPPMMATVAPQPLPAPVAPPAALRDERDASFALRGAAPGRPAAGQDAFAATFNNMIAQSASTVTTAPANAAFMPSAARPIQPNQTMAPPLAQMAYNQSLGVAPASLPPAGVPMAAGGLALPGFGGGGMEPAAVVRFANGSSSVPAEYRTALRRVAEEYRSRGGSVRVVGHASSRTGSTASQNLVNFKVSQDRAQSVASELIRLGVTPQAIFTEAVADNDPLYDESNPRGEAENRRAEIYLDF